jgi:hypothetical protein
VGEQVSVSDESRRLSSLRKLRLRDRGSGIGDRGSGIGDRGSAGVSDVNKQGVRRKGGL